MKDLTRKLSLLKLAFLLLILLGCEHQDDFNTNHEHDGVNPNAVSFEFFQETTKIENLDKFLRNTKSITKYNKSIDFDDYFINTDYIYQCILEDGDVSFSFDMEPIQQCLPTEEFNLVIKRDENNNWFSRIFKLTSNTNGQSRNKFSKIQKIYSANGLPNGLTWGFEYHWVEDTEFHCTQTGDCASGVCDLCRQCVTTTMNLVPVFVPNTDDSLESPDFNYNSGGGGGGGSSGIAHQTERNLLINSLNLQPDSHQYNYISRSASIDEMNVLIGYLNENTIPSQIGNQNYTQESKDFVNELIMRLRWDSSGNSERDLNALNFVIEAKKQNKIYNDLDIDFLISVDQYLNMDIQNMESPGDPVIDFILKVAIIRATQPELCDGLSEWQCDIRVFWDASKDIVHIALDGFGLVPVVGEIADLVNGGLYLLEGDGVNATLSFASAIPFAGWVAFGSKYAIKIVGATNVAYTINTRVKLVWKVLDDGSIYFGSSGSKLRKALGIFNDMEQAHHLIPWAIRNNPVVQKAAKSGSAFHMNETLNGIPVASWRNQPNHNTYNNLVESKLNDFNNLNPNASVDEAYDFVNDLVNDIRDWVVNNPNSHLNDLVLP